MDGGIAAVGGIAAASLGLVAKSFTVPAVRDKNVNKESFVRESNALSVFRSCEESLTRIVLEPSAELA